MENFLKRINASEELIDKLRGTSIKAQLNNDTKKVIVTFEGSPILNSRLAVELYSKTNKVVNQEMNTVIECFNYTPLINNDLLVGYDFLRQYLIQYAPYIDLAHVYLRSDDYSLTILVARPEVRDSLKEIEEEIIFFLKTFGFVGTPIVIELNPDAFAEQKLNKIIEESSKPKIEKQLTELIDEKVKPGFSPIDFEAAFRKGQEPQNKVYFEGEVFEYDKLERTSKDGSPFTIHKFSLGNGSRAVRATLFDGDNSVRELSKNETIRIYGKYEFDEYGNEFAMKVYNPNSSFPNSRYSNKNVAEDPFQKITPETLHNIKKEERPETRYEFHLHSKMSTLDGVSNVADYIRYAEAYNVGSITVTDHNTAQAFPEAYAASRGTDVIVNYGVEFDIYDDLNNEIVLNPRDEQLIDADYVFFDLETTSTSAFLGEIIEFGGVRYKDNVVVDRLQLFVKPNNPITEFTTKLTSITNEDVEGAPSIEEAIHQIKDWIGDSILVAHNASFDFSFLDNAYRMNGLGPLTNPVIDSMKLSWHFHPKSRAHRLGVLAKNEFVNYDENAAHRADYDAEVLCKIFERLIYKLLKDDIRNLNQINIEELSKTTTSHFHLHEYEFSRHINVISKNQDGLKDLNELVSLANVKFFNRRKKSAMLPLSIFTDKSNPLMKNILIGSSCSNGVLFKAILEARWEFVDYIIKTFDYVEIFPPTSYKHMLRDGALNNYKVLGKLLRKVKEVADQNGVPVIVTSNAHYTNPDEKEYRNILISAKRVGGVGHPLNDYRNPNSEKPDNHLRNISEIFEEFSDIFTEEEIFEMTITNSKLLQDKIEKQKPIKDKLYSPKIPGAEDNLKQSIKEKMAELYGAEPHESIVERVDRELEPILEHGFGIIYYLSAVAVKKSNEDGYLVGSRGSVGSSLAATFSGITDVNPLPPHYRCTSCKFHEFTTEVDDGYDLPEKICPVCKSKMTGDGHNIPFETFLGFNADKVPDIDLNFSRDNQSSIHLFMKDFLGEENVFRAGTISTAALKTAVGYVRNYEELTGKNISKTSTEWLARKIEGAKRTTGQHPGGLIVIPDDMSVYDFTPINYPGDDYEADWKTTHFDFHSIHDNLLKLDFLGHLDPSSVRMLQTLTGIDPNKIPMNDQEVISLFTSNEALKYKENYTNEELGIIGIPEFGTFFVRNLVREAKPNTFADLVRISGLSHGTDVWTDNAQSLIKNEIAKLSEVICVRDDIMTYLISKGVDKSMSFDIMESVRKGKGLTPEWEHSMRENQVPDWYIESAKKIKYMFPKAHATAYVMMAFRIAWYKINYPLEYYATYFSKRDIEIEFSIVLKGIDEMQKHYAELQAIPRREKTKRDDDMIDTYLIIFEMYSRGFKFENIDIHKSRSENFVVDRETGTLIPPFSILGGVGSSVAKTTTTTRKERPFKTVEDFKSRCGLPKKVIEILEDLGVFEGISTEKETTQQLSLFE